MTLKSLQLGSQDTEEAVELAVGYEVRQAFAEVSISIPEAIPFATPPGPLRNDGRGKDFASRERGGTAWLTYGGGVSAPSPIVRRHVQGDEHGFGIHPAPVRPQNREVAVLATSASRAETR